jgi:hypothetical protein
MASCTIKILLSNSSNERRAGVKAILKRLLNPIFQEANPEHAAEAHNTNGSMPPPETRL